MIKTIKLENREITFNLSVAFLYTYKNQFNQDPLTLIAPLLKNTSELGILDAISDIGIVNIYNLLWASAYAHDVNIGDPETFAYNLGLKDVLEIVGTILPAMFESFEVKKNSDPAIQAQPQNH